MDQMITNMLVADSELTWSYVHGKSLFHKLGQARL